MRLKSRFRFIWICSLILLAGCSGGGSSNLGALQGGVAVDSLFQDFYQSLGGTNTLGPAISPSFNASGITYQYIFAGLMAYDPEAASHKRFYMAAIGRDMGIAQPPQPPFNDPNLRYVDGHTIEPAFVPLYDRLGKSIIGEPLTEARYNPVKQRYEQYFANLGFYRLEGDPPGAVKPLGYGPWGCAESCQNPGISEAEVAFPYEIGAQFTETVARLGTAFTGFPVTAVYQTPEGYSEQAYEHVVLIHGVDPDGRVQLRPITERLDIQPDPLVEASESIEAVFVTIDDEMGRSIPQYFWDYLALHGGLEVSGLPIDELVRAGPRVFRQCFANLCLEEHRNEAGSLRIRPASLGYVYSQLPLFPLKQMASSPADQSELGTGGMQPGEPTGMPAVETPIPPLALQAWAEYPQLAVGQRQEIVAQVMQGDAPLPNIEPDLMLTLPDGTAIPYYMYPTDADGQSRYFLDPLTLSPGRTVRFEVCVYNQVGKKTCVRDRFQIQSSP